MGHIEDGELSEQSLQEVITGEELEGQVRRTRDIAPAHAVIPAPEGHGEGAEIA